jgi:hypothetical protein
MSRVVALLLVLMGWAGDPEHSGQPLTTDTASTFLSAFADGRAAPVAHFISYPFSYREAWASKRCTRVVEKENALPAWIDCAHAHEGRLIEALRAARKQPLLLRLVPGAAGADKKLKALAGASLAKSTWVNGTLTGDGFKYELLIGLAGNEAKGRRITSLYIASSADK